MNKVICYTRHCLPSTYEEDIQYFELFSVPQQKARHIGHVGNMFLDALRKAKIQLTPKFLDFAILAMSVAAADKAFPRKLSADGWTRKIDLEVPLYETKKWNNVREKMEKMLRFLSGDFWKLSIVQCSEPAIPSNSYPLRENDCICLLSGGMDSLIGGIDLCAAGRNPLFVAQTVRGDAEHQKEYAKALGTSNLCQWSCHICKHGGTEQSTRARSIVFFAYALLASCAIGANTEGRKEIYVPENGFISLNIPLDPLRSGSLSTKTTHPMYMKEMQDIWNEMGFDVDLITPYQYKTKGEVLLECKNQERMKSLIMGTTSCGKYLRHKYRHCGVCIPCLVRRASFMKAGMMDETEGGYCEETLKTALSPDLAAAAFAVTQYEKNGTESLIRGELNFADLSERRQYVSVFERGLCEIRDLLKTSGIL